MHNNNLVDLVERFKVLIVWLTKQLHNPLSYVYNINVLKGLTGNALNNLRVRAYYPR